MYPRELEFDLADFRVVAFGKLPKSVVLSSLMVHRLGPLGKVIVALLTGLCLGKFTALWFSSWKETSTAAVLIVGFQLLVGLTVGALARGQKAAAVAVTFSVSLLGWPAWNGLLGQVEGLEFYGTLEVAPTMAGAFLALAIHRQATLRHRQ